MYTLYTRWVICVYAEVNFEVILIKGYAWIEADNVQNLFSSQTLFLEIEERSVFNQVLLIFQRKEIQQDTNDPKVCIKS